MTPHIKLNEEQKQLIKDRFLDGERLLGRVESFKEDGRATIIIFSTAKYYGISPYASKDVVTLSYTDYVTVFITNIADLIVPYTIL